MSAARKLSSPAPKKEFWELQPKPRSYSLGDISRREYEPAMQIDCTDCGALCVQQLVARYAKGGEDWQNLGCAVCQRNAAGIK